MSLMLKYKRQTWVLLGGDFNMSTIFAALSLFLLVDASQAVLITQWPQYISSLPDGSAEMRCFQNDTDYDYLFWYRQKDGESFQMVASLVADLVNLEEGFQSGFEAATVTKKLWSLKISSVQRADQAGYLCAASLHNAAAQRTSVTKTCRTDSWLMPELSLWRGRAEAPSAPCWIS